jgi:carboxymethylenebutenolidase
MRRAAALAVVLCGASTAVAMPQTVSFASGDGKTELVGYLSRPAGPGPFPAIILLHGRTGPYASAARRNCTEVTAASKSPCSAASLSARHAWWNTFWAERGILALHVDSFGPRGKGHGFARFTHGSAERTEVNERTVRPHDALGALAYLRQRDDVIPDRIALQGWSNGGSTVLNLLQQAADAAPAGLRIAVAFYPGCGNRSLGRQPMRTPLPLLVLVGSADEEVSAATCRDRLGSVPRAQVVWYEGATHGFDSPDERVQRVPANRAAAADARARVEKAVREALGG